MANLHKKSWMISKIDELFRTNVGNVSYVEHFFENEKFRGSGVVEFTREEDAKKAVAQMHNYKYKGTVAGVRKNCPKIIWILNPI